MLEQKGLNKMKKEMSLRIQQRTEKTGLRMAAVLDELATSVVLAVFEAISRCTAFALDRFYPSSKAINNEQY